MDMNVTTSDIVALVAHIQRRYRDDPIFHQLVRNMEAEISEKLVTPEDFIHAAMLVREKYQERKFHELLGSIPAAIKLNDGSVAIFKGDLK